MNPMRLLRITVNQTRNIVNVALDRNPAGRGMTVLPGDIFIASYPKSGNTWTRFLLGNLIYQDEPITFANIELRLPSIYLHSDRKLKRLPRIMKSHDCFDPRYQTVIYIVRDPRDVLVSAYHYSVKRKLFPDTYRIQDFVTDMIDGSFDKGIMVDPRFGRWHDNVASWLAMRHNRKFLLLRYEDMLEDPRRELLKVAEFLGLEATPERLERAVRLSSADHMRNLEKKEARQWALTKDTRLDKAFVRKARSGNWRSELSSATVAQIETVWGPLMRTLGYELVTELEANREVVAPSSLR